MIFSDEGGLSLSAHSDGVGAETDGTYGTDETNETQGCAPHET
jgi:hypothetical protein